MLRTYSVALHQLAQAGEGAKLQLACKHLLTTEHGKDVNAALQVAVVLQTAGYLTDARNAYKQAISLAPNDGRARINLAALEVGAGNPSTAWQMYQDLCQHLPDNATVRRSALTSLEYIADAYDIDRLRHAKAWGQWALSRADGWQPRPHMRALKLPLLVGYVSSDLCQHTVGLFVKDVLKAHDPGRVQAFLTAQARGRTG